MCRIIWEIDFDVIGPLSIKEQINFRQPKGFDSDQFYSNINLKEANLELQLL